MNKVMKLFFKLINFKHKTPEINEYLSWIKEKYVTNSYRNEEKKNKSTTEELIDILDEIQLNEMHFKMLESNKIKKMDKINFSMNEIMEERKSNYINAKLVLSDISKFLAQRNRRDEEDKESNGNWIN